MTGCEAKIVKQPDKYELSDRSIMTSIVCQRCELSIGVSVANPTKENMFMSYNFATSTLQSCPKLIKEGYIKGEIPPNMLPEVTIAEELL